MPAVLQNFITEFIWAACKALENIPAFGNANFCSSLE